MTETDLDHVGFAVHDAAAQLRRLHTMGVLLPAAGEEDDGFRYVIGRRVQPDRGIRIELLDPHGDDTSFLAKYLQSHGEGAHHITFMVGDLDATLGRLREIGVPVTQVDVSYPPWREAFIHPSTGLGTVVQLASSTHTYPAGDGPCDGGDPLQVPHRRTGRNRHWWRDVIDTQPQGSPITVAGIELGTTDLELVHRIFAHALGGTKAPTGDTPVERFVWQTGYVDVRRSDHASIALRLWNRRDDVPDFEIGRTSVRPDHRLYPASPTSRGAIARRNK